MRTIQIYDTTLRDGSQGEGVHFSLHDKVQIALRLDEIGIDFVEGGYPLSNEKDAEFFCIMQRERLKHSQLCAFGMTRRKSVSAAKDPGMQALLRSEAPVITIVGKTWDFHVTEVLAVTLAENIDMIAETVGHLRDQGRRVIYDAEHFFDGWKANPTYAAETIRAAARAGAETVTLCDTNGGSMTDEIARLTGEAVQSVEEYKTAIGIHCHNDCELAVANSLAAVAVGAAQVQGTINGIGERCGNVDLISVIANLGLKPALGDYRLLGGSDLSHLTELSRFVYEIANLQFRDNQPFVGRSAFAHKGGMHVHAVARAASTYEHVHPEAIGNERRILVSELSGRSNIVALTSDLDLQADGPLMNRILQEVVKLENIGYQFEAANGSFDLLVQRCAGTFQPQFELMKYHVDVEHVLPDDRVEEHGLLTEATVKIRVKGQVRHEVAEGDGPVNALDAALRKALCDHYPRLAGMRLVDYKVRVVNEEAGTAARIRVVVESADEEDEWGTVGVSENIIEASWKALADAVEYKLWKDERPASRPPNHSAASPR